MDDKDKKELDNIKIKLLYGIFDLLFSLIAIIFVVHTGYDYLINNIEPSNFRVLTIILILFTSQNYKK